MAKRYEKLTQMRVFLNDKGTAKWGNGRWKPYKDGVPGDVHLRGDEEYSVAVFENDDGSLGINISRVVEYSGSDDIRNDISQPGMKKLADTAVAKNASGMSLDDDIPF